MPISPSIIALRDMRLNASMPSTLTTVADSSLSVIACTMWATHSHPTFVDRAYWFGCVLFHYLRDLLGYRSRHETPQNVANCDASDAAIFLAQCCNGSVAFSSNSGSRFHCGSRAMEPLFAHSLHIVGGSFAVLFTSEEQFWEAPQVGPGRCVSV